MLDILRRNTKVILWITVISFVLLIFLVWGADLQFGGHKAPQGAVGTVNGEPITVMEYQQELAQNREAARKGGRDLQPSDELIIEEQTWTNIVARKLLRQQAEKRNLGAKDSEVRSILYNNPPPFITQNPSFRNQQGQFDMAAYRSFLNDPSVPENTLVQIEDLVRRDLPLQKLQEIITASVKVTEDELRNAYADRSQKAKVTYTVVEASRFQADSNVTDEEIAAWYKDHQDDYRVPERVDLEYVTVPRVATAADSASILQDLSDLAVEARAAEHSKSEGESDVEHSTFDILAQTFSQGPNADKGGLSAGFLTPAEMSPPLKQAVQGLEKGGVSAPYRDGGFYHIVQLVDTKEEKNEPSYQIRDLAMRIAPSDSTVSAVQDQLETVHQEAQSSGLAAAAKDHGLELREAKDVTPTGIVPGLASIPQITAFAHDNPVGTLSRILATNNAWYLVQIASSKPAGVAPLDEVKDRVKNDILRDRRLTAAKTVADRVEAQIKAGEDLAQAARAESLQVTESPEFTQQSGVPGLGRDPEVVGAAFGLPVGQVSEPIKTPRGWVILRVDERPDVDWAEFDKQKDQLRQTLLTQKQNQFYSAWLGDIRKKAKVEDYRTS
jgi:parvulin-like peptidyl-prolyl isomerase